MLDDIGSITLVVSIDGVIFYDRINRLLFEDYFFLSAFAFSLKCIID